MVKQVGKIFITPGERAGFAGYRGTATIHVPGTGQVYRPGRRGRPGYFVKDVEAAKREAARQRSIKEALAATEKRRAEEKARLVAIEKARLESARKAREEAMRRAIEDATRKRLSTMERQRFISQESGRIRRGEEAARKTYEGKIERLEGKYVPGLAPAKELFIGTRVIDTMKVNGKVIPITEVVIVSETGKFVRKATAEEKRIAEESRGALRPGLLPLPEESLSRRIESLSQKEARGELSVKEKLELAALTTVGVVIGTGIAITQLPELPAALVSTIKGYIQDPKNLMEIPAAIGRGGEKFGYLLKTSPTEAIAKIGANIFVMHMIGKVMKITGRLTSRAAARLSPKFRGVKGRAISIPSLQKGKDVIIRVSSRLGRGRIPEQLKFAGKRVTAVSAQANRIVKILRTRKIIRKPIRGEAKLTKVTKKLLKKFDKGKISAKELIRLDRRIRAEAKKGLLERSLFADPKGVVRKRFLKLGTEKEASLLDYLSGDVTFKTSRPQILIFEKVKVQAFPKTKIFKSIIKKLKTGKTLTQKEGGALLKFQLKRTGKLKPLGFQTTEMELTLAPGEIVKKVKTIAVTIINGRRVPIVRAIVVKAKAATKNLLSKAKTGKLTAKELKLLRKYLRKETGFVTSISDSAISLPRYPLGRKALSVALKPRRRKAKLRKLVELPGRIPKRKKKRKVRRRVPKGVKKRKPARILKRIPKIKPRVIVRRRPLVRRRVGKPLIKPLVIIPKRKKKKKIRKPKKARSFHVYARPLRKREQKKPKLIRVTKKPIKKKKAEDLRNYLVDTSLSRTAGLKGSRRKPFKRTLKAPTGYSSKTQKKFRKYKIVKGKRVPLRKWRVIEKKKYLLDTKQEKRQITLRKRISQLQKQARKPVTKSKSPTKSNYNQGLRKTIKRKASPAQLAALKKGRKILAERRKG